MTERLVSIHRVVDPVLHGCVDRPKKIRRPTPEQPLIISASELRDFLRCRLKWWWRHQCRLERDHGSEALEFGTLIHAILEEYYRLSPERRTQKAMRKVAKRIAGATRLEQLTTEDYELAQAMTIGYAAWVKPLDREIGLVEASPEEWFEYPLTPDGSIRVRGKIDLPFISQAFKKTAACREFKSKGQIRIDNVEVNLQLSVYLWALRRKFPKMKRYIAYYTVLRKQMPGPRVRADLFHQEPVERTDEEIDMWAEDTQRAALDMLDASVYANPDDSCGWSCDYQIPCLQRGNREDLIHILTTGYRIKERR